MSKPQTTRVAPGWIVLLVLTTASLALLPSVGAQSQPAVPREVSWPEWDPLPSPDGQYVAVYGDKGHLAIQRLSAGEAPRLATSGDIGLPTSFVWSKDSKRVFYGWCHKGTAQQRDCTPSLGFDLRVIGLDGHEGRVLSPRINGRIEPIDTSADGRHVLALLSDRPSAGTSQVALISIADGTVRELKTADTDSMRDLYFSRAGALSPDGRYVAYTRQRRFSASDIFMLSTDGNGIEHALIGDAANDQFVGWAPGGHNILFTSDRAGTMDLWSASVTNGRVDELPVVMMRGLGDRETASLDPLVITSNGTLYYNKRYAPNSDVQVVSLEPRTARILSLPRSIATSHTGATSVVRWSPDGRQLAYASSSERNAALTTKDSITILSVDSWSERRVKTGLDSGISNWEFNWAPDGRSFLVSVTGGPASARGLYTVDAQTGQTATLFTRNGAYLTEATWLPDGRSIVFAEAFKSVIVRNLATAEERTLYGTGMPHALELSPDGRQLAVLGRGPDQDRNKSVLTLVGVGDERARSLGTFPAWVQTMTWSADGRFILYFDKSARDSNWELWRVPAAGGSPEKLGLTVPNASNANRTVQYPSLRGDGRRLAFSMTHWRTQTTHELEHVLPITESRPDVPGLDVLQAAASRRLR